MTGDEDYDVRNSAAEALGEIGKSHPTVATGNGGALIKALVKAMTGDEDDSVRKSAATILGEIGKSHPTVATGNDGALVNTLVKALTGDEHEWVRGSAAKALSGFDLPILLESISELFLNYEDLQKNLISKLLSEAVVVCKQSSSKSTRDSTVTLTFPSRHASTPIEITQEKFQVLENIATEIKNGYSFALFTRLRHCCII